MHLKLGLKYVSTKLFFLSYFSMRKVRVTYSKHAHSDLFEITSRLQFSNHSVSEALSLEF